jgi:hypothetical protein
MRRAPLRMTQGEECRIFAFLPVEIPSVFAVLFEAAKAKFPQCNNRVRLAKTRERFCV